MQPYLNTRGACWGDMEEPINYQTGLRGRHTAVHLLGKISVARYCSYGERSRSADLIYTILSIFFTGSNPGMIFSHATKQTVGGT